MCEVVTHCGLICISLITSGDEHLFMCLVVVQSLSRFRLFVIPWTAARQASLSFTISRSLLKLMSIESVMPFNHLILCHPLLLPSIFSSIRVFSIESVLRIRWPKYWIFSYIIMTVTVFLTLIWGEGLGVNNLILLYSRIPFYVSIHTAN